MADEEDNLEEESDLDIPGIPDYSSSEIILKSPSENSKALSHSTAISANEKSPSILSQGSRRSSQRDSPSVQSSGVQEVVEEKLSKSQEELKSPQDISLGSKKSSLEQLSKEKVPKAKATRIYRQCNRRFREIIGKRELKNEELEKHQSILKQRLNILECSMPAVMVWNIWRMTQSPCVPNLQRVLQKQFQGPASGEVYCPNTPSRHFDCRVREMEAERKQAYKRVEEAKTLWTEKMATLEDRHKKLEEAKKIQEETRERIQLLTLEVQKLREAATKVADDGVCETGECGAIECKKKWLEKVPSCTSIKSADVECLEKLELLAENEVCMKRQIADLESREQAYMRTLQQADDLWCKVESDAARTMSGLQDQLNLKNVANQQLANRICELEDVIEQLRARLTTCRGELEKYMSVSKIEALIGKDDDFADVLDKDVFAVVDMTDRMIGRADDVADVDDVGILAKDKTRDRYMLAVAERADVDAEMRPEMVDADWGIRPDSTETGLEARPDLADVTVGVYRADLVGMDDAQMGIHPDDFAYEDERLREARAYLARIGSLSELDKYGDDYICAPDFICNDVVFSETGLTEEEMIALRENRVTPEMLLEKHALQMDLELQAQSVVSKPTLRTVPRTKEVIKKFEATRFDVDKVEPTDKVKEERRIVDKVEPVEEIAPIKELEPTDEVKPVEDVKHLEEIATIKKLEPIEEVKPVQDVKHLEEIAPKEEPTLVEDIKPVIDIQPIEEISPIEEIRSIDEIKPMVEITPVQEAEAAEQIKLTEDTKPILEAHISEPVKEEPVVEKAEIKSLPTYPEEVMDKDNILVPRDEMLSWQDDVDSIRAMIAKCIDCVVLKPDADKLAAMMATYTGTEVKEIVETPRPRDEVKVPRDELPAEIEVQVKPEVTTVEVSAVEEVPKADAEVTVETPVLEEVVKKEIEPDYLPKPPTTPLTPETSDMQEDSTVPKVAVTREETLPGAVEEPEVEETKVPVTEKPMPGVTEVKKEEAPATTGVKKDISPERVEMVPAKEIKKEIVRQEEEKVVTVEKEAVPVVGVKVEPLVKEETEVTVKKEETRVPKEEKKEAIEAVRRERDEEVVKVELHPGVDEDKKEPVKKEIKVEMLEKEEGIGKEPAAEVVKVELLADAEKIKKEPAEVVKEELRPEVMKITREPKEEVVKVELIPEVEEIKKEPVEKEVVEVELIRDLEEIKIEPVEREVVEVELIPEAEEITKEPVEKEVVKVELIPEVDKIKKEPVEEEVVKVELIPEVDVIKKEPVEEEVVKVELIPEVDEIKKEPVEEEIVKVELLPEVEKVEKEPVEEIEVKLLPEEEKEIKEVLEEKEEEEIMVPLDIKDEIEVKIPEKEKIDLDVKVLPEEKVEAVPKEEKKRVPAEEEVAIEVPKRPVWMEPELISEKEKELVIPCICSPMPPPPTKKIEITQTEITRIETVQVITQTVVDVETQTTPKITRQVQPQIVTVTKAIDPDSETMERLLNFRKPLKEQMTTMTIAQSSHTHHSTSFHMRSTDMDRYPSAYGAPSQHVPLDPRDLAASHAYPPSHPLSNVLRSLRMEGVHMKSDPEKELRSIYYGMKSGETEEGKCNCCQCGKTMPSPLQDSRTHAEGPSIMPTYKVLSVFPVSKKVGSPTDQTVQHDTYCPECKLRKLREVLKAQDPLKKVVKKPTRDQEVCTCITEPGKGLPCQRIKRVSDQSCMAKIPKSKPDRVPKRIDDEYQNPVHCACSGLVETGKSGVLKKVHCACGDPD